MGALWNFDGISDVELPADAIKRLCAGQKESQVIIFSNYKIA